MLPTDPAPRLPSGFLKKYKNKNDDKYSFAKFASDIYYSDLIVEEDIIYEGSKTYWSFGREMRLAGPPPYISDSVMVVDKKGAILPIAIPPNQVAASLSPSVSAATSTAVGTESKQVISVNTAAKMPPPPPRPAVNTVKLPSNWSVHPTGDNLSFFANADGVTTWVLLMRSMEGGVEKWYNCSTLTAIPELPAEYNYYDGSCLLIESDGTIIEMKQPAPAEATSDWSPFTDENGNIFYYNSKTGESSWTAPQ